MASRRRKVPSEEPQKVERRFYKIKPGKQDGQAVLLVYCDGDWLRTCFSQQEADAEVEERKACDRSRGVKVD